MAGLLGKMTNNALMKAGLGLSLTIHVIMFTPFLRYGVLHALRKKMSYGVLHTTKISLLSGVLLRSNFEHTYGVLHAV